MQLWQVVFKFWHDLELRQSALFVAWGLGLVLEVLEGHLETGGHLFPRPCHGCMSCPSSPHPSSAASSAQQRVEGRARSPCHGAGG